MGPRGSHPFPSSGKEEIDSQTNKKISQTSPSIKESSGESSGLPPIRICDRQPAQGQTQRHQQSLEKSGDGQTTGSSLPDPSYPSEETSALVHDQEPVQICTIATTPPVLSNSYGRVSEWLGGSSPLTEGSGDVVQHLQTLPYQHPGSNGSPLNFEEAEAEEEHPHPSSPGQSGHCTLPQQGRFQNPTHQSRYDGHFPTGQEEILASVSFSSGRSSKRGCGLPLQINLPGIGVDSGRPVVPVDTDSSPRSSSGSVRNRIQLQDPLLRCTKPGPSSLCDRRSVVGLEPVGQDISVPSSQLFNESPPQTPILSGQASSSSPQLAKEQLVSSPDGAGTQISSNSKPEIVPNSANQDCISFILANEGANFMDFLKFAANRRFQIDSANVSFTESDKTDSTIRQYDSAFRKLTSFIRKEKPKEMSINLALSFFRSLHEAGLASSTVTTIKSALVKIFSYGFDMDLNDFRFSSISRACARQRPASRPTMLSWSLNKVLELASNISNDSCSYQTLLRKTLFLVALASGARLSEMAALSREKSFIRFLPSGGVSLSPHPKFIAKNEDPANRWKPWVIVPLPQNPSLCPVKTLQEYLERTNLWTSGKLFRRDKGGTITINGIRQQILYFIKEADPESIPKAHQVRAIATSINYFHHMDFKALTGYTGWKSPKVFMKHYFKNIDKLRFHTVAAGKVVPPNQSPHSTSNSDN